MGDGGERSGGLGLAEEALAVVLLFGVVSLLGDMSYEGFRSALPVLVRGGLELGGVVGLGEVLAWSLRPATGLLADRLGAYWGFTGLGYALIPVGVLAASQGGVLLVLGYGLERLGKALRSPSRDALLGGLAGGRRGLVFGLHEAMDQVGAVAGPLLAYAALARGAGLWLLAVPAAFTLPVLAAAWRLYPRSAVPGPRRSLRESLGGGLRASLYVAAVGTLVAGPLAVEYVARVLGGVPRGSAPLLYAVAMLSDALAAVPLGVLYDRSPGAAALLPALFGVAAGATVLAVGGSPAGALAAAALSGVAEAGFETVARAMVRGGAGGYGLYGLARGASAAGSIALYSWLAGLVAG
ncbi:hypothetical protein CF15_01855 [Pyrodictium occultum]|uniref:Major facilitator superfamily (MFS) profile domain-containing protein n=1 Tax=Pyrodictium occultum TaxID=2309 RepID=A0A0V8RU74_PYROC|nr:hypothetical protein [Pyrodictium occultum]KSW11600.1 hypothetical protein CF15_01855 [Pyrodictium occultum]